MKIKILGTRGEIKASHPHHAKHSGVLIDDKLLLDLGEKEFLNYDPKWIFITHLHPDHAYFVRWKEEEIPDTQAPIYSPELPKNEFLQPFVQVLTQPIKISGYTIIPIPTHHSKLVKSQAYLIKKGKNSLLYTGDLVWINKDYHSLFEQVDLIITEGSFLRKGGMIRKDKETNLLYGHGGIPNLINLFKDHTSHIALTHFGSWFYKDPSVAKKQIQTLSKQHQVHIIVGYDGLEIEMDKLKNES